MAVNSGQNKPPLVALVGRPNVGKSTLFNRLTGERRALVDDQPGVTRDRNYGHADWLGQVWRIVDTGGFEPKTDIDILRAMRVQSEFAVEEADAVILILDGREGVTPADHEVAHVLRRNHKTVLFAVNKIDGPKHENMVYEFHELGAEKLFGISAEHGHGVGELLDELIEVMPGLPEDDFDETADEIIPRVAVVGRPNVGKSTLVNRLLGEDRLLVHDSPGTTRDTVDTEVKLGGRDFVFIDTAGMRRKSRIDDRIERFSVMRSVATLDRCHIAVLVMEATEDIVDQDAKIAGLALERGRALVLVFNKWDLVEDKEKRREELDRMVADRLRHVDFAPIITMSALEGKRTGKLPALLIDVWDQFNRHVGTGELNRRLEQWIARNNPPSPGGKQIKIHYATQSSVRPPTFVFFANRPEKIPTSYQRYLNNQIREAFGFEGAPIRAFFRGGKKKR